jgi:hypothetical protein
MMILNFKQILMLRLFVLFLLMNFIQLQSQTVVHNTGLNVIYLGFPNKLLISSDKIKRENLEVECLNARIVDSIGFFFITVSTSIKIREVFIKIKDKNKQYWEDSVYFRVKKIPNPEIMLGSLSSGVYPKEIISGQRFLNAAFPNFIYENIKAKVLSYHVTIINPQNLMFYSKKNIGNRTQEFSTFLTRINGYSEVLIDSIKYELLGENYYASPMRFTTLNDQKDFVLKVKNQNSQFEIISATSDNFEKLNKSNNVLLYQVVNSDTFLLSEKKGNVDSSYYSFTKYHLSKTPAIEFNCQKINDSTFKLKGYDSSGFLFVEGFSSQMEFDFIKTFNVVDFESLLRLVDYNKYAAKDTWYLYNSQTKDVMISYFKSKIHNHTSNDSDVIHFTCGNSILSKPIGVWMIKDKNGKVLKSKKF